MVLFVVYSAKVEVLQCLSPPRVKQWILKAWVADSMEKQVQGARPQGVRLWH
jgi:hypothetical protein